MLHSSVRDQKKLLVENSKLKQDIEQLRTQLQDKQRRRTCRSPPPRAPHLHLAAGNDVWGNLVLFSFRSQGFVFNS